MSLDRRSFLRSILPAAAGMIVAPTLAETLAVAAKKYFFLNGNPLTFHGIPIATSEFCNPTSLYYGITYWMCPPDTFPWGGLSRAECSQRSN